MRRQLEPVWLTQLILCCFVPIRVGDRGIRRQVFERIWKRVWIEQGYATQDNLSEIETHYRSLRRWSIDVVMTFCLIPIGTMRLIRRNSVVPLPIEADFAVTVPWAEKDLVVEITLLTVLSRFRNLCKGLPFLALTRYSYRKSKKMGVRFMAMAADARLFRILQRTLKLPFRQIGDARFYEGSNTVPAAMNVYEAEEVVPKDNPTLAKLFR